MRDSAIMKKTSYVARLEKKRDAERATIESARKVWRILGSTAPQDLLAGPKAVKELGKAIEALEELERE